MFGVSADHWCWCHRLNANHLRRGEAEIVLPPENKGIGGRKSTFGGQNASLPDHNPDDLGVFEPVVPNGFPSKPTVQLLKKMAARINARR